MPDENEQDALSKIKAYLDAGHSLDAVRGAGWGPWVEHLEGKGYDLNTGEMRQAAPEPILEKAEPHSSEAVPVASAPATSTSAPSTQASTTITSAELLSLPPPDTALDYIARSLTFDSTVYEEIRMDRSATLLAVLVMAVAMFAFSLGAFLWAVIKFDASWAFFRDSTLIGTAIGLGLWIVGVGVGFLLLRTTRPQTAPDEVLRVAGFASAPLAIGVFMLIPEITFGIGLFAYSSWALSYGLAFKAIGLSGREVAAVCLPPFAIWGIILPLIVTADNGYGPGIFWFESIREGMVEFVEALQDFDFEFD